MPLQQRAPPVGPQLQGQGTTFLGTGQPQQQPASVTEQQLASQVVQAQSQQISELVQLVKNLGEMQAASLARGAVSASAGASGTATGAETVGDPMEVDRDTGGVRHNKAENYLPKIPMLSHEKMGTRASEIANWAEFTESISSWLALLDDFYPVELYRATITDVQINQNSLEKGPAARSARFHNLLKQSLVGFQRGLDIVRLCEQLQLGASCGYESFRRLNLEFGIQSRLEATSIRESTLAFRPGKHVTRPLDVFRAVEAELLRSDRTLNSYPSVRLSEAEKIMLHFRCISEECKQYVLLHGKSDTLEQLLKSIKVFDSHLRLISYEKESKHAKSFWNEDTLAAFNKGKGKKGKDSKGKGKKGEKGKDSKGKGKKKEKEGKGKGGDSKGAASKVKCFNCDEVGQFARDCPHPKKEKGAGASGQPKAKASPQPTITMMLVADISGAPCFHFTSRLCQEKAVRSRTLSSETCRALGLPTAKERITMREMILDLEKMSFMSYVIFFEDLSKKFSLIGMIVAFAFVMESILRTLNSMIMVVLLQNSIMNSMSLVKLPQNSVVNSMSLVKLPQNSIVNSMSLVKLPQNSIVNSMSLVVLLACLVEVRHKKSFSLALRLVVVRVVVRAPLTRACGITCGWQTVELAFI